MTKFFMDDLEEDYKIKEIIDDIIINTFVIHSIIYF
jgi:hypothetical protein